MRLRSRALATVLASVCAVACMAGVAAASRLETSSQTFSVTWSRLTFHAGAVVIECPVTLEGSFHSFGSRTFTRAISKVSGQLIGHVRSAQFGGCSGGEMRANPEALPWHVQYNSFEGALPNITGVTITLVGALFEAVSAGVRCHWGTTQRAPMFFTFLVEPATGRVTGLRALEERTIPLGGEMLCPFASPMTYGGTAVVTGGGGRAITIRLVA
jgi:hypothetical protein